MASRYYHGGPKGLASILPPYMTHAKCTSDLVPGQNISRRDCVYVTTSFEAACMFASVHAEPCVYRVEPSNLRDDPDCDTKGLSFEADFARVISKQNVPGKIMGIIYLTPR